VVSLSIRIWRWIAHGGVALSHSPGDVQPRHVKNAEWPLSKAEVFQSRVDFQGAGPVFDEIFHGAAVGGKDAVADEALSIACNDWDLAQPAGQLHQAHHCIEGRHITGNYLNQLHRRSRGKETHAGRSTGPGNHSRQFIDVEV